MYEVCKYEASNSRQLLIYYMLNGMTKPGKKRIEKCKKRKKRKKCIEIHIYHTISCKCEFFTDESQFCGKCHGHEIVNYVCP